MLGKSNVKPIVFERTRKCIVEKDKFMRDDLYIDKSLVRVSIYWMLNLDIDTGLFTFNHNNNT